MAIMRADRARKNATGCLSGASGNIMGLGIRPQQHWHRMARIVAACVLAVSCAGIDPDYDDHLQPRPFRDITTAGVGLGAVLGLHPRTGKPDVRPLSPQAFRDNSLTWLGHSSFLINVGGRSLLLDPLFTNRPEIPVPIRPRRISQVPPGLDRLHRLDAVVISHADHDHLDLPTLRMLAARFPDARLLLPAGTERLAEKSGFRNRSHLDVYETVRLGRLALTTLPARHYARRDVVGLNRGLAFGWEIAAPGRKIYFSGDTGHGPVFDEIRRRRGRFDIALVPIGGYAPAAAFEDVHASPEEAVAIAATLGAPIAVGHHWGTFGFGLESPQQARDRFLSAQTRAVKPVALDIGETMVLR
jgi:N-acyl-phosphatidylethanolamine-hydrolysing phospholipase D